MDQFVLTPDTLSVFHQLSSLIGFPVPSLQCVSHAPLLQQLDAQPLLPPPQGSNHLPQHQQQHRAGRPPGHNPIGGAAGVGGCSALADPSHPAHRVGFSEVNPLHHTVHAATSSASSCSTSSNSSSNYLTIGRWVVQAVKITDIVASCITG